MGDRRTPQDARLEAGTMNWASAAGRPGEGALWGAETEDLNATLVRWGAGKGVGAHTNDEVDVVMTILEGAGVLRIDGDEQPVEPGMVIVIPKGTEREVRAETGLVYLNVHRRKRKLMPTMRRD